MRRLKRIISSVLTLAMILSMIMTVPSQAYAGKDTTRAIGIVFDNSGSMYMGGEMAWCRATYAIEVIASMMNDSDVMQIYPMNNIQVNGVEYTMNSPLVINGPGDAEKIRSIYTPKAGDTPIEPIQTALEGLKNTSADEKWLILLTDGATFYRDGVEYTSTQTREELSNELGQCAQELNVIYMGIGSNLDMPSVASSKYGYYADKASSSEDVLEKLTEMCNRIFRRDALAVSSKNISFDLSMKKLFIFVQGTDISSVKLLDSSGQETSGLVSSYSAKYSELGTGSYSSVSVDRSLQGVLVTYQDLDAGSYTLDYSGNMSSIGVYYEPDVDMVTYLRDANGNLVDLKGDVYSGSYTLEYALADKNGNITTSALLGNVKYDLTYSINGEEYTVSTQAATGSVQLDLNAGDTVTAQADVTYLSDYTIHMDQDEFGWPETGLNIQPRPAGEVICTVYKSADEYNLSQLEQTGIYDVSFTYDAEPITGDDIDRTSISVEIDGQLPYDIERTDTGYTISLKYNTSAEQTECGDYVMYFNSTYTNEDGVEIQANTLEIPFTIVDDSSALSVTLKAPQDYFVVSDIDDSEPLVAYITLDGEPLSQEELSALTFSVDSDGIEYEVTPLYDESAYEIKITGTQTGKYKITTSVEGTDKIGRTITATDSEKIELSNYPQWMRIAFYCLIAAIIIALLVLFLNAKVLPKKILITNPMFLVDSEQVTGNATCSFPSGGKKTGTLTLTSPQDSAHAGAKCGFRLTVEAVSPRRVKSANRSVRVTKVDSINSATQTISIGTANFIRDEETSRIVRAGGKKAAPFEINTNANVKTTGVVQSYDGDGDIDIFFSAKFKFK